MVGELLSVVLSKLVLDLVESDDVQRLLSVGATHQDVCKLVAVMKLSPELVDYGMSAFTVKVWLLLLDDRNHLFSKKPVRRHELDFSRRLDLGRGHCHGCRVLLSQRVRHEWISNVMNLLAIQIDQVTVLLNLIVHLLLHVLGLDAKTLSFHVADTVPFRLNQYIELFLARVRILGFESVELLVFENFISAERFSRLSLVSQIVDFGLNLGNFDLIFLR